MSPSFQINNLANVTFPLSTKLNFPILVKDKYYATPNQNTCNEQPT